MVLHGYCRRIAVLPHTWQQKSRLEGEFSTSTSFVLVTSGLCLQPRTSTCITIQIRLSISLVKLPKANPQVGARNPVLPPAPFVRFFRTFVLSFWPSVGLLEERCLNLLDGCANPCKHMRAMIGWFQPSTCEKYIMQNHGWKTHWRLGPGTWV